MSWQNRTFLGLSLYLPYFTPFQTADMVYQDMIMCGPYGQASVALQALGEAVMAGSFGTFTNAAVEFGRLMDSPAFDVFSTALLLLLVLMWVIIQLLTLKGIVTRRVLGLDHGWGKPYDDRRPAIIKEA
ncbi:unnamed protein product [Penicillium viridicatum]